jgi:hypothetical protein
MKEEKIALGIFRTLFTRSDGVGPQDAKAYAEAYNVILDTIRPKVSPESWSYQEAPVPEGE